MRLTLPSCDVLCFCDLPPEEVLVELKEWLEEEKDRTAMIFSEKSEQIHPKIQFCTKDKKAIGEMARKKVFLHFEYIPLKEEDSLFFSQVETLVEKEGLIASDFRNRGVDRIHNLLQNSKRFRSAYDARDLFGAFFQIPAIICGGGPSLEKEIPKLRQLKERALFFAGGTALGSLSHFELAPHFGGLIDPHPPQSADFLCPAHEIPHFFQHRVHYEKLHSLMGPLLWTPGSEGDFFEESPFDGGWNVSTYLTALACHLGCNPIILVGVDLCGDGEKSYAGGIERKEGLEEMSEGVFTRKDWLFAARFLSDFAKKHPEVSWINASNGIDFAGFEKKELKEIAFESEYDLQGMVHAAVQNLKRGALPSFDREEILKSLERVSLRCEELLRVLESSFPNFPKEEYTILTFEMEREEGYTQFAKQVWQVWEPPITRSLPKEMAEPWGIEINKWIFIKGICDDARKV